MAKKKSKARQTRRVIKMSEVCFYCENKKIPDYKEYKDLAKFLSDRAKIIGMRRSGICSTHQRKLSVAIKRARHLGLLPYSPTL